MRKKIFILTGLIIILLPIIMTYIIKGDEKIIEDKEYTKLFNEALTSDGAYAEGFYSEISSFFLENPTYLIEQISLLKEDERDTILFNLAYIMCINETDLNEKFNNLLYEIRYKDKNLKFNDTLDRLIEKYESIKKDNSKIF